MYRVEDFLPCGVPFPPVNLLQAAGWFLKLGEVPRRSQGETTGGK